MHLATAGTVGTVGSYMRYKILCILKLGTGQPQANTHRVP